MFYYHIGKVCVFFEVDSYENYECTIYMIPYTDQDSDEWAILAKKTFIGLATPRYMLKETRKLIK